MDARLDHRAKQQARRPVRLPGAHHIVPCIVLAVLVLVPLAARGFVVFQVTLLLAYGLAILGLNVLTGASGQFSLGQSAFFALGAYTSAILMEQLGLHYAAAIVVSGLVAFAVGFLFGWPALRLSGTYLALATFSLAIAVPNLLKLSILEPWTGGVQGVVVSRASAPFDWSLGADAWMYYVTLAISTVIYFLSRNLLASRSGRALMAIRDNEIAAAGMGINVALYKTLAFGVSAAITGIAGAVGAMTVQFVSPDSYTVSFSISLFLGMVVGGVGWLPGSLVGAAFMIFVPNLAEEVSKGLSGAIFGSLLLAVIFVAPHGARQVAELATSFFRRGVPD